jgi:hypothetical protein
MIYPVTNMINDQPCFEKPIDDILADIKQEMLSCKQGQSIEVKRKRKPTSQKQRGNTFGNMVKKIKNEANEVRQDGVDGLLEYIDNKDIPKGVAATDDFIMKVLYKVAPTYNELGEEVTLSKMNTKQAADFFKRAALGMSGYVYIPDPNPNYKEKP